MRTPATGGRFDEPGGAFAPKMSVFSHLRAVDAWIEAGRSVRRRFCWGISLETVSDAEYPVALAVLFSNGSLPA